MPKEKEYQGYDSTEEVSNYLNNLQNQSYRTMLQSEIQAQAARDQALKYTNNALANQGLASQGVSESIRSGINNQYQNRLSQGAAQYQQDLLNIAKQNIDYKVAQDAQNYNRFTTERAYNDTQQRELGDYAYELLSRAFTEDENGRVTKGDFELYKKNLESIGADLSSGEPNFDNVNISDVDKMKFTEIYNELKNIQGENSGTELPSETTEKSNGVYTQPSGNTVNFYKGSGTNYNFYIKDSNGNMTEWEMGSKYTSYPNLIDKAKVVDEESGDNPHQVGDIWVSDNGTYLTLLVKDQNKKVRMVEGTSKTKKDYEAIAALFSKYLGKTLTYTKELHKENGESYNEYYFLDENGNKYYYSYRTDGAIALFRK